MRTQTGRGVVLLDAALLTWRCSRSSSSAPPPAPDASSQLQTAVKAKEAAFVDDGERGRYAWHGAQRFYRQNGYQLAWSDGKRPRVTLDGLIAAVRAADQDGLDPADYDVGELDAAPRAARDTNTAIDLDLRVIDTSLRYANDLSLGTTDPEDSNPEWHAATRTVYLRHALHPGLDQNQTVPDVYEIDRRPTAATGGQ